MSADKYFEMLGKWTFEAWPFTESGFWEIFNTFFSYFNRLYWGCL